MGRGADFARNDFEREQPLTTVLIFKQMPQGLFTFSEIYL